MCWTCDRPGSTDDDFLNHMYDVMLRHGWAIQGVEGDRLDPPWAYTVGLTELGLPELVVSGLELEDSAVLLNSLAGHLLHAEPPEPGCRTTLNNGLEIEVVAVVLPESRLYTAASFFGARFEALQFVWSDEDGRWPWDRGFRGRQQLFGPRAVAA